MFNIFHLKMFTTVLYFAYLYFVILFVLNLRKFQYLVSRVNCFYTMKKLKITYLLSINK